MLYTTNAIESLNFSLRKLLKTSGALPIANGVSGSAGAALPIANGVSGSAGAALPIANGVSGSAGAALPKDEAILNVLYLGLQWIEKKWTMSIQDWKGRD